MQRQKEVDARGLEAALAKAIRGEVRFDAGSRALYATDSSNYRQVPIGVVMPQNVDDVMATVALARKFGAPILARGGGTSLAGQCCNVAVVMDFSKYMNRIVELDPQKKFARVQPGIVLSTRDKGGGDAFFQKRVPRGAPDYVQTATIKFPSGRTADEICPTEIAVVGSDRLGCRDCFGIGNAERNLSRFQDFEHFIVKP